MASKRGGGGSSCTPDLPFVRLSAIGS